MKLCPTTLVRDMQSLRLRGLFLNSKQQITFLFRGEGVKEDENGCLSWVGTIAKNSFSNLNHVQIPFNPLNNRTLRFLSILSKSSGVFFLHISVWLPA